jgi:predicted dehydrogenase
VTIVRVGIVGIGHLGRHHARLLAAHTEADLVAGADTDDLRRHAFATEYGRPAFVDYRELEGKVDAVIVAVPTRLHRAVTGFFLERGVDVMVEKPIAATLEEGKELVDLAKRHARVLQVGHVERFNPAFRAMAELGMSARYVEAERLAPFSFRSTDVGVVLDLMIHDIDLALGLMRAPVVGVEAFGGAVFTPAEDMASALVKFADGGVAHLTASRVALKPLRRMRVFSQDGYVGMDLQNARATLIKKNPGWDYGRLDLDRIDVSRIENVWKYVFEGLLTVKELKLDPTNALQDELSAFLATVKARSRPMVSGEDGLAALDVAQRVLASIAANRW